MWIAAGNRIDSEQLQLQNDERLPLLDDVMS